MSVPRSSIELALDEIASDEGGMRFQGLAVVLAKLRWPELVACERKSDLGLDAYASASVSPRQVGMGLACSITSELGKIKKDADRAKPHFPDLQVLVFATSAKVQNKTAEEWKKEIQKEYGWELIVMSREDIITTLQIPEHAGLCSTHLGIPVPKPESDTEALLETALAATGDVLAGWSRKIDGRPVIDLRVVRLDEKGGETQEIERSADLYARLSRSQRVVIEAPAGRGKTTTLVQLARAHQAAGRVACLVDLPAWVRRNVGIFEFLAGMPEFQSRGLTAGHLARINREQQFTFLLNGWNELVPSESTNAAGLIRDLERSFAAAGIAVATRAHPVTPPLPGAYRFKIQTLTRWERDGYLHGRIKERAEELIAHLDADPVLSDLTTTPMILAEVTSLFEAGKPIPASKLGVLDAVTRLMENVEEHQAALADVPLSGMGRRYLEELGSSLVASGGVQIGEEQARPVITSLGRELHESGQIATVPDPGAVLTVLCSHHVLERSTYPDVSYTFFHQQFQELFAALRLKRELSEIAATGAGRGEFAATYINEPAWSQPLYMLAEFIGRRTNDEPLPNAVAMGKALVEMALPLDAIFTAELARLCGAEVWAAVRGPVEARLRHLYRSPSGMCRTIGLAAMVASGSDNFTDILVPLLSSADRNFHFETYRAWAPFHISSLGKAWEQTVRQWNEEARLDFVCEIIAHGPARPDVISFALTDPSAAVRKGLLSNSWWTMSPEEIVRFAQTLDDEQFANLLDGAPERYIPPPLRSRAAATFARIAEESGDQSRRLSAWSEAGRMGDGQAIERLKETLSRMTAEQVGRLDPRNLLSTIEFIEKADSPWVAIWVIDNMLSGGLRHDGWTRMVKGLPETRRDELLDRVTTENLMEKPAAGVIPLLRTFADDQIVRRLFRRLCELRPIIATSRPGDDKQAEAKLARQLEDLLREMPVNTVVESVLQEVGGRTGAVEIEVVTETFHKAGRNDSALREGLSTELREAFREYLKTAIATVLTLEDPHGTVKAHFATVLAQVGGPSDLPDIELLIQADLERFRAEKAARVEAATRGRVGPRP